MTLKEYYKKRLTEDSLNETSARVRKLATMTITSGLSALGGSVLGAVAPHIRSATIGNPGVGLFGPETHPARRALAGTGVGLGVSQVGSTVGGIVSGIRRRRKLEEATPAEIQAHQIQRLDKLGDKVGQKNLSNPANLRAATRIAMLYNKAGVAGGKYPYSGIAGSPGMITMPTRPAHPKAIAAAETGLKGLRGSNRTVGQRIRGAIKRTIGLEENKQ